MAFSGQGALGGAASGASTGAAFGPWGAAIGGAAGGVLGGLGGGKGSKGPSAQQMMDQQTRANRPNQNTAWGSSSWVQDGKGNWTQSQTLNPALQGLMDTAIQRQQQGIDYGALPQLTDGAAARDQAITGAYNQATSRLDPQFQQGQDALRTQLYNQGLREGDPAYDQQMGNFDRNKTDAYNQAMYSAIGQGTSAGNSMFQNSLAGRQQMLGEANQQMNQPLQGFQGLLGSSGMLSMPQFMGAGNATNGTLAQQQMQNQNMAGMFSGMGSLGSSVVNAFGGKK